MLFNAYLIAISVLFYHNRRFMSNPYSTHLSCPQSPKPINRYREPHKIYFESSPAEILILAYHKLAAILQRESLKFLWEFLSIWLHCPFGLIFKD